MGFEYHHLFVWTDIVAAGENSGFYPFCHRARQGIGDDRIDSGVHITCRHLLQPAGSAAGDELGRAESRTLDCVYSGGRLSLRHVRYQNSGFRSDTAFAPRCICSYQCHDRLFGGLVSTRRAPAWIMGCRGAFTAVAEGIAHRQSFQGNRTVRTDNLSLGPLGIIVCDFRHSGILGHGSF